MAFCPRPRDVRGRGRTLRAQPRLAPSVRRELTCGRHGPRHPRPWRACSSVPIASSPTPGSDRSGSTPRRPRRRGGAGPAGLPARGDHPPRARGGARRRGACARRASHGRRSRLGRTRPSPAARWERAGRCEEPARSELTSVPQMVRIIASRVPPARVVARVADEHAVRLRRLVRGSRTASGKSRTSTSSRRCAGVDSRARSSTALSPTAARTAPVRSLIVADVDDTPKQMYAAMGFRPIAVEQKYLLARPSQGP